MEQIKLEKVNWKKSYRLKIGEQIREKDGDAKTTEVLYFS